MIGEPNDGNAQILSPDLGALLADYDWGFSRHERLDVKKPGPPFDVKNQHFKHDSDNQTDNRGSYTSTRLRIVYLL